MFMGGSRKARGVLPLPPMNESSQRPNTTPPARDPFVRRLVLSVLVVALAGVLLVLLILGVDILLAAFGGILFAILLRTLASPITRFTPLGDGVALTVVVLLGTALLVLAGWLLAPQIGEQTDGIGQQTASIAVEVEALPPAARMGSLDPGAAGGGGR
jgi:predicted PurR-regulated permease PerM